MMSDFFPLVSICIPTYNGEAYIEACMDSALQQTYSNLEIIVSDDASRDKTLAIIEKYKNETKIPIHVFNHQPNGIGANWNNCVKYAEGDYIKFLFQDDLLDSNCILEMVQLMASSNHMGMVYARREIIADFESDWVSEFRSVYNNLHEGWGDFQVTSGLLSGKVYLGDREFLNSPKNKIGEPTSVLLKKECFEKVGYFNETMKQALDCEFWYRLMPYYDVGFIDKTLSKFRLHDKQASTLNKSSQIDETKLLYHAYYLFLLKYLHPKNKWKLIKLFHPIINTLVRFKQKMNSIGQ